MTDKKNKKKQAEIPHSLQLNARYAKRHKNSNKAATIKFLFLDGRIEIDETRYKNNMEETTIFK